jgi:ApbE superfamily uncharacterized protein (UPF0280 family)
VEVTVGESDLWIGFDPDAAGRAAEITDAALGVLRTVRAEIEARCGDDPAFLASLEPLPEDPEAPPVVGAMLRAARAAGVGPMAAVAGAVAEAVGRALRARFGLREVVVENGGDLWLAVAEPLTVAVYAGLSSLSGTFGVVVAPELCPCGLATSSGTVGPSLSFGKADAALAIAADAALADAWATALGNLVRSRADAEGAVRAALQGRAPSPAGAAGTEHAAGRPLGALVVVADVLAAAGALRLAPLPKERRSR